VHKDDAPVSDSNTAQELGEKATTQITKDGSNALAMFRYNPGKQGVIFPPKHPYSKATPEGVKKDLEALAAKGSKEWVRDYKREIYQRPLSEQYTEIHRADGGGTVSRHLLVNEQASDYNDVLNVAKAFANEGKDVQMLPIIHQKDTEARKKLFPNYKSKLHSPDLKVNEAYWEVEKTNGDTRRAVSHRIFHGFEQADNVVLILDDKTQMPFAEKLLQKLTQGFIIK
jgi:hypothetical protein